MIARDLLIKALRDIGADGLCSTKRGKCSCPLCNLIMCEDTGLFDCVPGRAVGVDEEGYQIFEPLPEKGKA